MRGISNLLRRTAGPVLFAAALTTGIPQPGIAQPQEDVVSIRGNAEERAARRQRLFDALGAASNQPEAQLAAAHIWLFWFEAPDQEAAELMRSVLAQRRSGALRDALRALDTLVETAPEWAEAWNQRATIRFMTGDFQGSLDDIDRVLPLEPKHFGALAGQAIILRHLGRHEESQAALRRAVEINPFLAERGLLEPEREGEDI